MNGRWSIVQYFKHNNWASFVRQMHMYGFQKRTGEGSNRHEFRHENFYRGVSNDVLAAFKRKRSQASTADGGSVAEPPSPAPYVDLDKLDDSQRSTAVAERLQELHRWHRQQEEMDARLTALEEQNGALAKRVCVCGQDREIDTKAHSLFLILMKRKAND